MVIINLNFFKYLFLTLCYLFTGHVQVWIDITTKSPHTSFYVVLHKNTALIGDLKVRS